MSRNIATIPPLATAIALIGCASNDTRPTAQLAQAETLIERAERNGARVHSPLEVDEARQKLDRAREASEEEEYAAALRLAEQAAADAEYAAARARAAEAEQAAQEIRDSIATLRQEATR